MAVLGKRGTRSGFFLAREASYKNHIFLSSIHIFSKLMLFLPYFGWYNRAVLPDISCLLSTKFLNVFFQCLFWCIILKSGTKSCNEIINALFWFMWRRHQFEWSRKSDLDGCGCRPHTTSNFQEKRNPFHGLFTHKKARFWFAKLLNIRRQGCSYWSCVQSLPLKRISYFIFHCCMWCLYFKGWGYISFTSLTLFFCW